MGPILETMNLELCIGANIFLRVLLVIDELGSADLVIVNGIIDLNLNY